MSMLVSKSERIICLGVWPMDDLCVHAESDDVRADPPSLLDTQPALHSLYRHASRDTPGRDLHSAECTFLSFLCVHISKDTFLIIHLV